jgi:hypothetical protein
VIFGILAALFVGLLSFGGLLDNFDRNFSSGDRDGYQRRSDPGGWGSLAPQLEMNPRGWNFFWES